MIFCTLNTAQHKQIHNLVYTQVSNKKFLDENNQLDIKALSNYIYNLTLTKSKDANRDLALTVVSFIPRYLNTIQALDDEFQSLVENKLPEILKLKKSWENGIENVAAYLNVSDNDPEKQKPEPLPYFKEDSNDLPPFDISGDFDSTVKQGSQPNIISKLIDEARENGTIVLDAINPKEIQESSGGKPLEEGTKIVLKSSTDPILAKHHYVMENLSKKIRKDQDGTFFKTHKLKLEFVTDENKELFYQRDKKSHSVIAMFVDGEGDYIHFDDKGNETDKESGKPFGIEYEDKFYRPEFINVSRNYLGDNSVIGGVRPNYGSTTNPMKTVTDLLHNRVDVYANILGITAGTLSGYNNNNTFNNARQEGDTKKMRPLQELIDAGEIDDQIVDIRVAGTYLEPVPGSGTDQSVKVGQAFVYDVKGDVFIPLTGVKLKDVKFLGTPINNKNAQLYEVIDLLDKTGQLTVDQLRDDKTKIFNNENEVRQLYEFLKQMLYSKHFAFVLSKDMSTIRLIRNSDAVKANSLWDANINYVRKAGSLMTIPLSAQETEEGEAPISTITYQEFVKENFLTGAAQAVISGNDVRFTKLNKRVIMQLEKSHNELKDVLTNGGQKISDKSSEKKTQNIELNDWIHPVTNEAEKFKVVSINNEEGIVTLRRQDDTEESVKLSILQNPARWTKIEKVQLPEAPQYTQAQFDTLGKIDNLPKVIRAKVSAKYRLTQLLKFSPAQQRTTPSTVAGTAVDAVAKAVFSGQEINFNDEVNLNDVKSPLSKYFKSEQHFKNLVKDLTNIKNELAKTYAFRTGITLYDEESGIVTEADMIMVDKDGKFTIADFKTSYSSFNNEYLSLIPGDMSNKEYFATQLHLLRLVLQKQLGTSFNEDGKIVGLSIVFEEGKESALDTKFVQLDIKGNKVLTLGPSNITSIYKKDDGSPLTSLKAITEKYEEIKNQKATVLTGKAKSNPNEKLEMKIGDIQKVAANKKELQQQVDHLKSMFGEDFVVNWVNHYNSRKYGEWDTAGITLYKNAISGTPYHEGWHMFSQLFLTRDEKIKMYGSIRNQGFDYNDENGKTQNTANLDDLGVEEMLANEWVKYVANPNTYQFPKKNYKGIKGLFRKLWDLVKGWFSPDVKRPSELFKDLYNGDLSNYKKDINNAIWGKLNSAVINYEGKEILNHSRSSLYVRSTSYFIGKILRDNQLSFTWLSNNITNPVLKKKVRDEFIDLLADRLGKLSISGKDTDKLSNVLANPDQVIRKTIKDKGINAETASKFIGQIQEINNILDDYTGGFDSFYDFYTKNSDIDTVRDATVSGIDLQQSTDDIKLKEITDEHSEFDSLSEEVAKEIEESGKNIFGDGPNTDSAFNKATRDVKDFFKTMPIIDRIDANGDPVYITNELDIPETYEFATIFNKTKNALAGKFTIEEILRTLSNPGTQKNFPQSKFIYDQLQSYINKETGYNFSFLQKFRKVMGLEEVDNKEVIINFDAADPLNKDAQRTVAKVRSSSRIGQSQDINHWQAYFKRPGTRKYTEISNANTLSSVFNGEDVSNILYAVDGVIVLNPFYDYRKLDSTTTPKDFLGLFNIELNEKFWQNSDSIRFADRLKSILIKNLESYKSYITLKWAMEAGKPENIVQIMNNGDPNGDVVEHIARKYFIQNPLQQFRDRRVYGAGDFRVETNSLVPVMEDLSTENSKYSLEAFSNSFTSGDGKTKWSTYETSLMIYRTRLLNNISNIKEFDNNIEYAPFNPNTQPWLRRSLFYQSMFDENGDKKIISGQILNHEGGPLSSQKVKIDLFDLSSYKTVDNGKYSTVHPKNLSPQDKLFFDTVSLFSDGLIEIPRAATSSSLFSVGLNSYDAGRKGVGFKTQYLPVDLGNIRIASGTKGINVTMPVRFYEIMRSYLSAEFHKMKWYQMNNPSNKLAQRLNVFVDILPEELTENLRNQVFALHTKDHEKLHEQIKQIIDNNKDEINGQVNSYFNKYITDLYNNKENSNFFALSSAQKNVITGLMNLYDNKANPSGNKEILREEQIKETLAANDRRSALHETVEKTNSSYNVSLATAAALFAMNQFILNVEYHTWYMGDNHLFSNPFKRGNLSTNTGTFGIVSTHTNHMLNSTRGETMHSILTGNTDPKDYRKVKTISIKDAIMKSAYHDNMISDLIAYDRQNNVNPEETDIEKKERYLNMIAPSDKDGNRGGYAAINAADGQAKIGLDAYRTFKKIFGTWDENTDEKEYKRQTAILRSHLNKYENSAFNKEQDLQFIKAGPYSYFNPQKWAYTGPELVLDDSGNPIPSPIRTKFDKMSLHVLLPEHLLGSGLADEKLMTEMAINDIDYAKFESAAKVVKHSDIIDAFDEIGNIKDIKLEDATPEWLLSSYLKGQQNTDDFKSENGLGSQQRVELFDVKYSPEVQADSKILSKIESLEKEYLDAMSGIRDFQKAQLLNRFGLSESGYGQTYKLDITNMEVFAAGINSIAKTNNFPSNMMEYLEYNPDTKQYKYKPSLLFNRRTLIDAIGGAIDKDIRKIKTKGTAAIQVTSVGNANHNIKNATSEDIKKYGTNGLHFYHLLYDNNGNITGTSTMGVKITLQGDFKNLLHMEWKGKKIKTLDNLNLALKDESFKKEHIDKLTFYAYRVPTNNNSFLDHAKIMEFLPESAGNIVIAPPEYIIKTGSDFDIDKMNIIFPSIDNNGELTDLPYDNIPLEQTEQQIKNKEPKQYRKVRIPIEDIYKKLNSITNSVRDYKSVQAQIKKFDKKESRKYDIISNLNDSLEKLLRMEFNELDPIVYAGMSTGENARSFHEILDYFEPYAIDDQILSKHIDNYRSTLGMLQNTEYSIRDTKNKLDKEFSNLLSNLNKYKDYHANKMLKAMKDTLSLPAYYKLLIAPSNTTYLTSIAEKIGQLTGRSVKDGLSASENTKYTIVNKKFGEYLVDSKDIGPYSIQRIWFSHLNFSKMKLNRNWQFIGAQSHDMRIFTPLAKTSELETLGSQDVIRMYGNNVDNLSPKEIWDQFMSLTIDLPSSTVYTLFGVNKLNKKVLQYLISSRYSVDKIMTFLNQPILQEVYSKFEAQSKELPGYMLKHAILEVAKKYNISSSNFEDLYVNLWEKDPKSKDEEGYEYEDAFERKKVPNMFLKNPGIYAGELFSDDIEFKKENLESDIKADAKTKSSKEFQTRQKNVLLYFMMANMEASNFTSMQFALSEDRSKNTNYYTIIENDTKKKMIRGEEHEDFSPQGSMFDRDAILKLEKSSIYSMFTYNKIAKLFYSAFAEDFTDLKTTTAFINLLEASNTFGTDRQVLATRIEGDFIEYIYKNFGKFNINVYDPFTDKLSNSEDRFGIHFINRIFNIQKDINFKTYGSKLTKFLEKYPELLERVEFVKRLSPQSIMERQPSDSQGPVNQMDTYSATVIRFNRSRENTIQERNFYIKQFENLINFNPEEFRLSKEYSDNDKANISAFFNELAYLTLYQSGPTNIADNFSDLVPNYLWESFVNDAFNNYDADVEKQKIKREDILKIFSMLYRENNPKVSWRDNKTIYNLSYYGKKLTRSEQAEARKYKFLTSYFQNFTAGKMYDIKAFSEAVLKFKIDDLTC